jgi:hypothetical protein
VLPLDPDWPSFVSVVAGIQSLALDCSIRPEDAVITFHPRHLLPLSLGVVLENIA